MIDPVQDMRPPTSLNLCLAIETNAVPAQVSVVGNEEAGVLAEMIARDLSRICPELAEVDVAVLGAHYDPVEILQTRWSLHRELTLLAARAPRALTVGQIVGFGSAMDGLALPEKFQPAAQFIAGPMRLVPIVVLGESDKITAITETLERTLLETGMASSETALYAKERFGLDVQHCRFLTGWDLAAMMHIQYQHANLGWLWPLLEDNLNGAMQDRVIETPTEPVVRVVGGEVYLTLPERSAGVPDERQLQMRCRQIAMFLDAHGIPVNLVGTVTA